MGVYKRLNPTPKISDTPNILTIFKPLIFITKKTERYYLAICAQSIETEEVHGGLLSEEGDG